MCIKLGIATPTLKVVFCQEARAVLTGHCKSLLHVERTSKHHTGPSWLSDHLVAFAVVGILDFMDQDGAHD